MNIRILEEENRLHLVFEGTNASTLEGIKAFIKTLCGDSINESSVDDFEAVTNELTPEEESKLINELNQEKVNTEVKESSEDALTSKYLEKFNAEKERFYYTSFPQYSSLNDVNKKAYSNALKLWIKDYYAVDPYIERDKAYENLKNHRGFFKVFKKMLSDEISSAEKQLGYEAGTFAEYASNDEIMSVFELCRKSLLDRASSK